MNAMLPRPCARYCNIRLRCIFVVAGHTTGRVCRLHIVILPEHSCARYCHPVPAAYLLLTRPWINVCILRLLVACMLQSVCCGFFCVTIRSQRVGGMLSVEGECLLSLPCLGGSTHVAPAPLPPPQPPYNSQFVGLTSSRSQWPCLVVVLTAKDTFVCVAWFDLVLVVAGDAAYCWGFGHPHQVLP